MFTWDLLQTFVQVFSQDFRLNANKIYSYVSRSFAKLRRLRQVEQLLSCVKKSGLNDWRCQEEILMSCINVLAEDKKEVGSMK